MSLREKREIIQVQILETDRLLELAGDHPLMSPNSSGRSVGICTNRRSKETALPRQTVTVSPERIPTGGRANGNYVRVFAEERLRLASNTVRFEGRCRSFAWIPF